MALTSEKTIDELKEKLNALKYAKSGKESLEKAAEVEKAVSAAIRDE